MRVADLDEVTYDLEVDGEEVRRTLHRKVWQRGAWATVALVFQDKDRAGAWKPAKLALVRLQRAHDAWKKHASMTLGGPDALDLAASLEHWRDALADADPDAAADDDA